MSFSSRLLGRRAIAAMMSVSMVTTVAVVTPNTVLAPAIAQPAGNPAPGKLSAASPSAEAGKTITINGTGFAPRTEGQSLAVDLLQKQGSDKVRFTLPATIEGSSFNEMHKRDDSDIYFGVISAADQLPNATNNGNFSFDVKIPADTPAGNYVIVVKGGKYGENAPAVLKMARIMVTAPAAAAPKPKVFFGRDNAPNIEYTSQGATVTGTFTELPVGTKVTAVGILDGDTIKGNWLPAGNHPVANDSGEIVVPNIVIPTDAPLGKGISASFETPDGTTFTGTVKRNGVTPMVGEKDPDKIKVVAHTETPGGLYESVYDPKIKALFASYTNFYSKESGILKADPATLINSNILAVPATEDKELTDAVFGITYDAKHDTLWTTNTKGPSVTLYTVDGVKKATLPLTNMVDGKNKAHPRSVVINPTTGKAYVGDAAAPGGKIYVYDTNNVTDGAAPLETISISEFGDRGAMEIKLDEKNQTLWTVGFHGKYLAKVDLANNNAVTTYDLGNEEVFGMRGAGVAIDTKRGKVYAASQEPSHVKVFDIKSEKVVKTIVTGASPLDALYDPVKDVVYVANRLSGTVNVIDPDSYEIIATRDVAPYPNQLSTDGKGNVFLTTKAFLGRYPVGSKYKKDTLYTLTFDKPDAPKGPQEPEDGSAPMSSSTRGDDHDRDHHDDDHGSAPMGSSEHDDDHDGEDAGSAPMAGGIAVVLALILGGLGWAMHSGMLKQFFPAGIPGLPQQ